MSLLDGIENSVERSVLAKNPNSIMAVYEVPLYFTIPTKEKINFGLAYDLIVAGWIGAFPAVRGVQVLHPIHKGKQMLRIKCMQENFENQTHVRFPPFKPIEYIEYVHIDEGGTDDVVTSMAKIQGKGPDRIDLEFGRLNQYDDKTTDNKMNTHIGPQRCLDINWKLPTPTYKRRLREDKHIFDMGYHFTSTDSGKTMSSRYEESLFDGKNAFNFMEWHNKYEGAPKLDKVIRRLAQCREFHGTLGGLSFLALSMGVPTTIHVNDRMKWTQQKKIFKILAKRSGAKFVEGVKI